MADARTVIEWFDLGGTLPLDDGLLALEGGIQRRRDEIARRAVVPGSAERAEVQARRSAGDR